jgi:hypothetical protein
MNSVPTTGRNIEEAYMADDKPANHKRSTIGLKVSTKERMDRCRAPGQCYDGFITQMVDHWEKTRASSGY